MPAATLSLAVSTEESRYIMLVPSDVSLVLGASPPSFPRGGTSGWSTGGIGDKVVGGEMDIALGGDEADTLTGTLGGESEEALGDEAFCGGDLGDGLAEFVAVGGEYKCFRGSVSLTLPLALLIRLGTSFWAGSGRSEQLEHHRHGCGCRKRGILIFGITTLLREKTSKYRILY